MTEIAEYMLSVLGGADCQAEFQEVINRKRSKRNNTPEGTTSGRFSLLSSACEPPLAPAPTQCPPPAQPKSKPQPRPRPRPRYRPRTSLNRHHSVPEEARSCNPPPEQHANDERSPCTIEGDDANNCSYIAERRWWVHVNTYDTRCRRQPKHYRTWTFAPCICR